MKTHQYETSVIWTGNLGRGTPSYTGYSRDHEMNFPVFHRPEVLTADVAG